MESLSSNNSSNAGFSTQRYVAVEEIHDDVIVLKNGSLRAVLMVSSVNFDLKASEEQDLTISQYQNFLNSLDFPIQIVIGSRRLNVNPYLEFLKKKESEITNDLLSLQLDEYRKFIKGLTEVSNIMSKFFYVIVPFYPVEVIKKGLVDKLFGSGGQRLSIARDREIFETYKSQLWQRVDHVTTSLNGTGVNVTLLKTEDLIELMYNSYNPSMHNNSIIRGTERLELM